MDIENFINEQNQGIWNELNAIYQIKLLFDPTEPSWRIKTEGNYITIITPTKKLEIASFTHELLHLYVDNLGISTPKEILYSISGEKSFLILTQNGLFDKIHNFCSHKKMFPYFIEMGFNENSFLSKWANFGCISYWITKMQLNQKYAIGVTNYIGFTISLQNNIGQAKKDYNLKKLRKLKQWHRVFMKL